MRIIKSIFCLSVCLFAVFFNAPLFSGEPAVIVTVDGLSFANTLLLPDRKAIDDSEHYLKAALDNMNLNLEDTTIDAFPWSRDANDTLETVEELHSFLMEKYSLAVSQNKRFIIVAH
ncbi:MAG: hypothetical protein GY757_56870, partial [bacterium]|nr:hypothetical protein [bacterium]